MSDDKVYPVAVDTINNAWIDDASYKAMYKRSVDHPDDFWKEMSEKFLVWYTKPNKVSSGDFTNVDNKWFEDGEINVCYNCVDRHADNDGDDIAIIWESDEGDQSLKITYSQLKDQVSRFANVMKQRGVKKGDRVCIYMPMIPEAAMAALACARIGAVHSIVFGGFSPTAIRDRILDSDCTCVITADEGPRGGKPVPLKKNVQEALESTPNVHTCIVTARTGAEVPWTEGRDIWLHEEMEKVSADCPPEFMSAEDPLFILYTSGSTGKPKGVVHTTAGYLLWAAMTFRYTFDYKEGEVYWCGADVGWITGHSYIVYGPLANGATSVMFEGVPNYPDASRFWQIIDRYNVNIFYTAPTAIRALISAGDEYLSTTSRKSLRVLGTVGEPINPEAWEWYYHKVGGGRCPIVDTWWQTETGGHMITPLPGATALKPGSATRPYFGVVPVLLDKDGKELEGATEGALCIKYSWPGQMRTVYGDHERFKSTYFSTFPGYYMTGDGARRDEDGYYWITGRVDDVMNVSGHRLGTAEIESALVLHDTVAEAAVVGFPHDIKGEAIYAYVTLVTGNEPSDELLGELKQLVRKEISPIATPDAIQFTPGLPKTRSGKIMRRILRKVAANDFDNLGDTSTLADPSVVDDIIGNRVNR